jgi:transposase
MKIATVGLDLAKSVFQVHGADERGHAVVRKQLRRDNKISPQSATSGIAGWSA